MGKGKDIGKAIVISIVITLVLIISVAVITALIANNETPESSIIHGKNILLEPDNKYEHTFTNIRANRLISWEWNITNYNNDSVKFWFEDKDGNKIYYFSSNQNQTNDKGEFIFEHRDDYTFVWENANQNKSVNLTINKLILRDSEGIEEPMYIIYILIPILILSYVIYSRRSLIKRENDKKPLKKYQKIAIVIFVGIIIYLIILNVFFSSRIPVEDKHVKLTPFDTHRQKYPELYGNLDYLIKWNIDENTTINFWIENEDGLKYKQLNVSDNITSQTFRFIPPKDGDYWLVFENPTNETIDLHYKYDPNTKDNLFDFLKLFTGVICAILIFMNIYLILKNKRIKKERELEYNKYNYKDSKKKICLKEKYIKASPFIGAILIIFFGVLILFLNYFEVLQFSLKNILTSSVSIIIGIIILGYLIKSEFTKYNWINGTVLVNFFILFFSILFINLIISIIFNPTLRNFVNFIISLILCIILFISIKELIGHFLKSYCIPKLLLIEKIEEILKSKKHKYFKKGPKKASINNLISFDERIYIPKYHVFINISSYSVIIGKINLSNKKVIVRILKSINNEIKKIEKNN